VVSKPHLRPPPAAGLRCPASAGFASHFIKKGNPMDIMVTAVVAFSISIIAALIAVIKRKPLGKIVIYAVLALIVGLPIGYFLAPAIISFF